MRNTATAGERPTPHRGWRWADGLLSVGAGPSSSDPLRRRRVFSDRDRPVQRGLPLRLLPLHMLTGVEYDAFARLCTVRGRIVCVDATSERLDFAANAGQCLARLVA